MLPDVKALPKEYDFVNYAMAMSDKKGYSDVVKALAVVKKAYPSVKLNLIGGCTNEYKESLLELIKDCGLEENVVFTPFFEQQEDLFQHLQKSRFAVLPCKMDSVASTIRQAMHYGLPVICYETEGTPRLNIEKQCVLIAENGNVADLADKMIQLLSSKELEDILRENAKDYSARWSDDEKITNQMVANFKAVVEHYNNGTPIPENLLYNSES